MKLVELHEAFSSDENREITYKIYKAVCAFIETELGIKKQWAWHVAAGRGGGRISIEATDKEDNHAFSLTLYVNEEYIYIELLKFAEAQQKSGLGTKAVKAILSGIPEGTEIRLQDYTEDDLGNGFWGKMKAKFPEYDWKLI